MDVATYRNGDPIPKVTDDAAWAALTTGAYCYYNNDSATYAATYGKLYNWYAVNDPRGLAPIGWHVATDAEWVHLSTCLGGNSVVGGALKEVGITHWQSPNAGATNSSGFTCLPGGLRDIGGLFDINGSYGYFWTSTQYSTFEAYARNLRYLDTYIVEWNFNKHSGCSVRCIKD